VILNESAHSIPSPKFLCIANTNTPIQFLMWIKDGQRNLPPFRSNLEKITLEESRNIKLWSFSGLAGHSKLGEIETLVSSR